MSSLRVIIFHVEHGFCAFVRTPTGHTLLIDCGSTEKFSPAKYILENELTNTAVYQGKYRLIKLIISHPHDDHISDIENLKKLLAPGILQRQRYQWEQIKTTKEPTEYQNLDMYSAWQQTYNQPVPEEPAWGVSITSNICLTPEEAKKLDEAKFVNNSSIPVVVEYKGTEFTQKFLFAGDLEKTAWLELLKRDTVQKAIAGTQFFAPSHHGHDSGYCKEIFDVMGVPKVNIVATHRRDESVSTAYSQNARGTKFGEETRKMITTRTDGTIFIEVDAQGRYSIRGMRLKENL
jgi:beta-lactamase superfamily II metal-dependent hydrolase